MNLERVFADNRTRPYTAHDVVLGDQLIGRPKQDLDDFERAGANGRGGTVRSQFTPCEIDLPLVTLIDQVLVSRGQHSIHVTESAARVIVGASGSLDRGLTYRNPNFRHPDFGPMPERIFRPTRSR